MAAILSGIILHLAVSILAAGGTAFAASESVTVVVEGLSGKERANVEAALAVPPALVREGRVDRQWLERFERQAPGKVRDALEAFGFYKPDVTTRLETPGEGVYRLTVRVDAGEPVRLSDVAVKVQGTGATDRALAEAVAKFPLRAGDVLRHDVYEKAKGELLAKALEKGYLDAHFPVHRIRVDTAGSKAAIDLVLETGEPYRFGDVRFIGAPRYPRTFLETFLDFRPGEAYSAEKLLQTQLNLGTSQRFRSVVIQPDKTGAGDRTVPVNVELDPLPQKGVRVGVGYTTDFGPGFSLRYEDLNVRDSAHKFDSELNLSQRLQGAAVRYVIPGSTDFRSYTNTRLSAQREDTVSYTSKSVSAEVERARGFGRARLGSMYLQLKQEESTAGGDTTRNFLLVPGLRFSESRYDSLTRPSRGFHYKLEARGTTQQFGSDVGFAQVLGNGTLVVSLPQRFSVKARGQAGATAMNGNFLDVPVTFRFFTGGDNSVRGYAHQSLGPRNDRGDVLGGKHLLVGSVELERAIGENWGVAAFYDAGNAFNDLDTLDFAQGAGLGIRYYTPVGPIRVDIARQVGVSDPDYRFHFTIGVQF
ncbi:MAG: outer membrane protein assembly factor [Syntrophaceae bacterium]|nr:outer membrane protein assembly factor [Syntrophaceae bacterium]